MERKRLLAHWGLALKASLSLWVAVGCGSEGKDVTTYRKDIQPLFAGRCTTCHETNTFIGVNIENPYDPATGLVVAPNSANQRNPAVAKPRNVVPFDPDNSYLLNKLEGNVPADGSAGEAMPLQIPPLTDSEIAAVERWVRDGATNDAFFQSTVQPIFGFQRLEARGKCVLCHYPGTDNNLDLTDPFGPNGLLQRARLRAELQRVQPGDPERSLLVLKVRARDGANGSGAPMPFSYSPLRPEEIAIVRQWIVEGAVND
jgi:hypothetical protein